MKAIGEHKNDLLTKDQYIINSLLGAVHLRRRHFDMERESQNMGKNFRHLKMDSPMYRAYMSFDLWHTVASRNIVDLSFPTLVVLVRLSLKVDHLSRSTIFKRLLLVHWC